MNPGEIINIELATNTLAMVGASASPVFQSTLPIGLLYTGIIVGGLLVAAVMIAFRSSISSLISHMTH